MTTISKLVEIFLKSKGMKKISGDENDASPLLPMIMMDSAYQVWCKYIKKVPCKHEMKKLKNEWIDNYNKFNKDYMRVFDDDGQDFVIEMMDNFEKFIEHDMMIVFVQFSNLVINEPLERQEVIASGLLCNVLCQSARIVWERVFINAPYEVRHNAYICACEAKSHLWNNAYYGKGKKDINPNENKMVSDAVSILCRKEINFLRTYLGDAKRI